MDNGENLHQYLLSAKPETTVHFDQTFGLNVLDVAAYRLNDTKQGALYARADADEPSCSEVVLRMIPYNAFANRGESDMLTWFGMKK